MPAPDVAPIRAALIGALQARLEGRTADLNAIVQAVDHALEVSDYPGLAVAAYETDQAAQAIAAEAAGAGVALSPEAEARVTSWSTQRTTAAARPYRAVFSELE